MKKTITFLSFLGLTLLGLTQDYNVTTTVGTEDPYIYNSTGTTLLAVPSNDVFSTIQAIPFTWSYYGAPVSSYKASDNGYITFNISSTISDYSNTVIPSVGGPNKAIYAFWDDLNLVSGTGSVDEVKSFTYGTAPNRTHVIQWSSVSPVSGSGYLYASIRIHECGDFDIVHDFGNTTGMSATVGCEDVTGFNGTMVEGPSFSFPALGSNSADDVVYSFFWDGIDYDAAIRSVDLGEFVSVGTNAVSGTFINQGSQTITSYDLNYSVDAGSANTINVTGVNIPAFGGEGTYNHSVPLNIASGGESHTICVWIDNINGNMDERTCNDELCVDIFSNNGIGASKVNVVLEMFTGSWCGWCPDGEVILEDLTTQYPENVFGVSVHDGDDMEYAEGIRSEFGVSGYPNGMIDRKLFNGEDDEPISRGSWEVNVISQLTRYTPVEVNVSHTYDSTTRTITATVSANFVDYASGDMRFVLEVIEDSVVGSGSGYDQTNYLNTTSGHLYEGAGDPIIGHLHKHVLRANEPGVFGNLGVIPNVVNPGSNYSETFTYVIPVDYDETKISLIGFVSYSSSVIGKREILNADQEKLNLSSSTIIEELSLGSFYLSPNPVDDQFRLVMDLNKSIIADIIIYNISGQIVRKIASEIVVERSQVIPGSVAGLKAGVYYITVQSENHALTKKMLIK